MPVLEIKKYNIKCDYCYRQVTIESRDILTPEILNKNKMLHNNCYVFPIYIMAPLCPKRGVMCYECFEDKFIKIKNAAYSGYDISAKFRDKAEIVIYNNRFFWQITVEIDLDHEMNFYLATDNAKLYKSKEISDYETVIFFDLEELGDCFTLESLEKTIKDNTTKIN